VLPQPIYLALHEDADTLDGGFVALDHQAIAGHLHDAHLIRFQSLGDASPR